MINTMQNMVNAGDRSVMMASHLMDDVERVCENMVLLHKGKLAAQGKIADLKDIDREIEIHVWGNASKLEEKMLSIGMVVRREGRIMRILHESEDITTKILACAAEVGSQIRRMHEYEASLEALFLVLMDNPGYAVKTREATLASPALARKVDAPAHMPGGGA